MNDQEINKRITDEVQRVLIALRYELVNAVLSQDKRIKSLEEEIKGLREYIKAVQMQSGAY